MPELMLFDDPEAEALIDAIVAHSSMSGSKTDIPFRQDRSRPSTIAVDRYGRALSELTSAMSAMGFPIVDSDSFRRRLSQSILSFSTNTLL